MFLILTTKPFRSALASWPHLERLATGGVESDVPFAAPPPFSTIAHLIRIS